LSDNIPSGKMLQHACRVGTHVPTHHCANVPFTSTAHCRKSRQESHIFKQKARQRRHIICLHFIRAKYDMDISNAVIICGGKKWRLWFLKLLT